jgi:hypothetical protein
MIGSSDFAASSDYLRAIEDAILLQEAFLRRYGGNEEFRLVAERILRGLQAMMVMLRAQHVLLLEARCDAVGSAKSRH